MDHFDRLARIIRRIERSLSHANEQSQNTALRYEQRMRARGRAQAYAVVLEQLRPLVGLGRDACFTSSSVS